MIPIEILAINPAQKIPYNPNIIENNHASGTYIPIMRNDEKKADGIGLFIPLNIETETLNIFIKM